MHKTLLFSILFFYTAPHISWAAPKFKSAKAVTAKYIPNSDQQLGGELHFNVKKGFHINEKAPNRALQMPEQKKLISQFADPQTIAFEVSPAQPKPPKNKTPEYIRTTIYVCDDALTVCEERNWFWSLDGKELPAAPVAQTKVQTATKPKLDIYGFIQDDLAEAKLTCAKTQKPILMLFSAQWCPGCMRMKKEVWGNKKMSEILAQFTKVKLDSDRFANKPVMESYLVAGIPAMLILNCAGEEISRFSDYQAPDSFKLSLAEIIKDKNPQTRSDLMALAKKGDSQAARTLANRSAMSGSNDDALFWFQKYPERESELFYWWAQLGSLRTKYQEVESTKNKTKLLAALQSALQKFPEVPSSLDWLSEIAEMQGEETPEGQKTLESVVNLTEKLLADRKAMEAFNAREVAGDFSGIEFLKIHSARAIALESLKKSDVALLAWQDGVKAWDQKKMKDEPSGQYFRFLVFLKKTKSEKRISRTFEKHLKQNPNDGEVLRRYAQILFDFGKYDKAIEYANRAVQNAFDRNEVFAALVYAKCLDRLNRSREAKSFLLRYLARNDLSSGARADISGLLTKIK